MNKNKRESVSVTAETILRDASTVMSCGSNSFEEINVNDRLVAVANSLLVELKECVAYLKANDGPRGLIGLAEAAIAKAEGRQ